MRNTVLVKHQEISIVGEYHPLSANRERRVRLVIGPTKPRIRRGRHVDSPRP